MKRPAAARGQGGFTYLGLIILLAILGMVGAAGLKMGALLQRAAAEEELLEIGAQFSEALRSYAAATPQGKPQQPPSLQDLLKDPRFPNPRRHLRKIFVDPLTGKAEWGIVWLGDKVGVVGVHSLSDARPLKVANFDIRFQNMENKERISDWKFGIAGGEGLQPAVATAANSMTGSGPSAPPSLFAPGGAGGVSAGGKGGKPGDAPGGGKPAEAMPVTTDKPMEPPAEPVAPEDVAEETTPEDVKADEPEEPKELPMPAQSDEEQDAEAARKKAEAEEQAKKDDAGGDVKASVPPTTLPPPESGRRRR